MSKDPASTRSSSRSDLILSRELRQYRTNKLPNPSIGGTRGFPVYQQVNDVRTLVDIESYGEATQLIHFSTSSLRR